MQKKQPSDFVRHTVADANLDPVKGASPSPAGVKGGERALVSAWQDAIRLGIRFRTQYGHSKAWNTYKNYYRGYFRQGTVPVNIIYAIGRSLIPQIYPRNPRVSVYPAKPGYTMHARMLERIDNWLIRECGTKEELKSMALDAYLCGTAPGVLGYDSEFGFNPSFTVPEIESDSSLSMFGSKGEKIEYNYNVSPGMPWFLRCNPMDFIVPWGTKRFKEAPWFAFRKMRPLADILEDPKYKNTDGLKGSFYSRLDGTDREAKSHIEDFRAEWVELFQVHDQRTGFVYALALDHPLFLRNEFDELQVEGLPAEVLGFNEDPDYFWWTPDCRLIEQQQLEINDIRTMAKYHRRVALLKVLYDKNMLGDDELVKLLDGDPKVAVAVDSGPAGDIRKAVAIFQSHVPPDLSIAAREVREDVREIVGFSRNQQGAFEEASGRRSATEAEIVRAAALIRIDERRDIMADLLSSIIRKKNQLIFKHWDAERIIDIVGPDGARYWIRFTGKELKGEFSEKVNPEEAQPTSSAVRRAEGEQLLALAMKVPGLDIKYVMESWATSFDWVDPQLLFPQSEGAGRSPEKAMFFSDAMRKFGAQGASAQPGLATNV